MRVCLSILVVILATCNALPVNKKVRYDNYKVYRVTPRTDAELQFLRDVASRWDTLDFWQPPTRVGRSVDVMVSPVRQRAFLENFRRPGLNIDTWISNVQERIDEEAEQITTRKAAIGPDVVFDYNNYHTYVEIAEWMDGIVATYPEVSKVAVSSTFQGQTVYGLRIQKNSAATNVAYIQGGIHAREWISPATMINLVKMYLDNYGTDPDVTNMLDNFIWIIVPVYNIDGYEYTQVDRMWRKNRNTDGKCVGVDLNRNFDYEWGDASKNSCTETYQGKSPLSESENSGAKAFLQGFGEDLKLYIDFHAYGQYWLYPWGYARRTEVQPDRDAQHDVATEVEAAIRAVNGKAYLVGESGPDMYPASGASEDFGYGSLGVKYSYVVELRDEGTFGFQLPAFQIEAQAEEVFEGMKTLGRSLVAEYGV